MATKQGVIENIGDYQMIFGSDANNTLTGNDNANIFLHQGSSNDTIKNFDASTDVILLEKGKVAQTSKSSNGKDVILKISDGKTSLGKITIKNAADSDINVYDDEKIADAKEVFSELTTAYASSVIKTFNEDADIQSILKDGEKSSVLAEIKKVNPELAANIANALKLSYESGISYLNQRSNGNEFSNDDGNNNLDGLDAFNNILSTVDVEATALSELSTFGTAGKISGAALSRVTTPLSVAMSFGTCVAYDSLLYSENVQGWIDSGSLGDTQFQKLALIREQNSQIFDGAAKSHINLACTIGSLVTTGIMGAVGVVGAPIVITAGAFCAASFALGWAYDNFVAKKLNDEANNFHDNLANNFNDIVDEEEETKPGEDTLPGDDTKSDDEKPAGRLKSAIESGTDYGKLNYVKYVAPHYYYVEVYSTGYYIRNNSTNYVMYKYGDKWDYPRIKYIDGEFPTVSGSGANLQGSAGNDTVYNSGDSVTISTGAGNDSVRNEGNKVTINTGAGNDYVDNRGSSVTINTGDGNDTVYNSGDSVTIDTGAGNDTVYNSGDSVTIDGGAGKDYIYISGGSDISVNGGSGNDTIKNIKSYVTIDGGEDKDYIYNEINASLTVIDGGKGNDTVQNYADYVTISGGDENDLINNRGGENVSINGGAGNDSIRNTGSDITISGGAGDDTIKIVYGDNILINYTKGDGNDRIYGFGYLSTLKIGDGKKNTYTTVKSGSDVIVKVGDGKITLKGAAYLDELNIEGTDSAYLTLKNGSSAKQTIGASIKTADASKCTQAFRLTGNKLANTILGGSQNDTFFGGNGNDSIVGNAGNDKLYGQNGADTLDGGAGNDTLTGGKGKDLFVYNGGNDVITDYSAGDRIFINADAISSKLNGSDAVFIVGKNTLTVKNVGRSELTLVDAEGSELTTIIGSAIYDDEYDSKVTLASGIEIGDASERSIAINVSGNALDNTIIGSLKNDTLYGANGNDYLIGGIGNDKIYGQNGDDILWGGIGNDTLVGGNGADTFIYRSGDGKDVISGFDSKDTLTFDNLAFTTAYSKPKGTVTFNVSGGSVTLKDFTATTFHINDDTYKISGTKLVKK